MTALDRAFIKAYTRPRRGHESESAAPRFDDGLAPTDPAAVIYRIDAGMPVSPAIARFEQQSEIGPERVSQLTTIASIDADEPALSVFRPTLGVADWNEPPLPTMEELFLYAERAAALAAEESSVAESRHVLDPLMMAVATTAEELRETWPARFRDDSPTLFAQSGPHLPIAANKPLDQPVPQNLEPENSPPHQTTSDGTSLDKIAIDNATAEKPAADEIAPKTTALEKPATAEPASDSIQPLAAFQSVLSIDDRVRPQLEVDRFLWPAVCQILARRAQGPLDGMVSRLLSETPNGKLRLALVGIEPTAGTTTTALALGRRAAQQGAGCVLVDADFSHPELATQLGVAAERGWSRVLAGEEDLGDILIASLEDRLALAPLEPGQLAPTELADNFRAPVLFDMLAEAFDLMLFDAGALAATDPAGLAALVDAARIDAVYLVYDSRSRDAAAVADAAERLAGLGVRVDGAIANNVPHGAAAQAMHRGEQPRPETSSDV